MAGLYEKELSGDYRGIKLEDLIEFPYVILRHWKDPSVKEVAGRAWKKTRRDGRKYFELRFDFLLTLGGKKLYAKAYERKLEPGVYDVYTARGRRLFTDRFIYLNGPLPVEQ